MDRGQILLITLLVLTVATTIALSLIGRATIDLTMSNQLEESTRAFDAAEAGVEAAMASGSGTGGPTVLTSGVSYDVTVNSIGGAAGVFVMAHKTLENVTETLWLVEHDVDGALDETRYYTGTSIDVCWSKETVPTALVITVLYKEGNNGTYRVARHAVDPNAASRGNNFNTPDSSNNGCGLGSFYEEQITFSSLGISVSGGSADTLLALRIRPEYSAATIAVDGGAIGVPKQGNLIESVGSTGTGVSRKVAVYQQYRAASGIFDSVIHSQSSFGH